MFHRLSANIANRFPQSLYPFRAYLTSGRSRIYFRLPKNLICHPVSHAGEILLQEQRGLDGQLTPTAQCFLQDRECEFV
jgi:hypothetical protein